MSEIATTENPHQIKDGAFVCLADSEASCHHYPDCECESWSEEHDAEHPPVQHETCWLESWFDAIPLEDMYVAEEAVGPVLGHQFPDGPIDWEWDGDGIEWHYADGTEPISDDEDDTTPTTSPEQDESTEAQA
jgi:hypothetical protein